jgi:predicted nucleic acid-binding protein
MSYLLDTNVISEFVNPILNSSVQNWLRDNQPSGLYLSVVTVGEIQQGIMRLPPSKKQTRLLAWFQKSILGDYAEFILPIDVETMLQWGNLTGTLIQKGHKMPVVDSLIAATALQHQLQLVTRNEADFVDTGLIVINPWGHIGTSGGMVEARLLSGYV